MADLSEIDGLNAVLKDLNRLVLELGAPPGPRAKFRAFSKLPLELRIKIYKAMGPTHRLLEIKLVNGLIRSSVQPVPVVLHLNHESRREVIKMYRRLQPDFHQQQPGVPQRGAAVPVAIYYHPTDTILFRGDWNVHRLFFCRSGLPLFRHIQSRAELASITALSLKGVEMTIDFIFWVLEFPKATNKRRTSNSLSAFTSLKKIVIYMAKPDDLPIRRPSGFEFPVAMPHQVVPRSILPMLRIKISEGVYEDRPPVHRQLMQIPGGPSKWLTERQATRLYSHFFLTISPRTYDATGKACIEIYAHDGTYMTTFWDESYPTVTDGKNVDFDNSNDGTGVQELDAAQQMAILEWAITGA